MLHILENIRNLIISGDHGMKMLIVMTLGFSIAIRLCDSPSHSKSITIYDIKKIDLK